MSEAWNIRFGTAGTRDSFAAQGYKSSLDVPESTAKMGLNAFEYQCGRGVRLGLDKAARMAALAAERDILFSVHAPYYISMSTPAAAANRAGRRRWKRRWIPCAALWLRWTRRALRI